MRCEKPYPVQLCRDDQRIVQERIMNTVRMSVIVAVSMMLVVGCGYVDEPIELQTVELPGMRKAEPVIVKPPADATISNRFTSVAQESETGTDAGAWSRKYEELSAKYTLLVEENMGLAKERNDLKKQLMVLQDELTGTKKELADANVFLQDMHKELTEWKGDVLGFRDEMRQAEGAQIQALTKIMRLLGAETSEPVSMKTGTAGSPIKSR